jgi:amidase
VECYALMKEYLGRLKGTEMRSLEDIVRFNDENNGSESGIGGLPAFMDGQDLFRKCVDTKGVKDETYWKALRWIRKQCRDNGIDAALRYKVRDERGEEKEQRLDALLFGDIKMAGINIAAQAGYPVITLPVGLDPDSMPVGITIIHTQWQDDKCIKWASAIEDLLKHENEKMILGGSKQGDDLGPLGRVPPSFKNHRRKNIPVDYVWRYKGAPKYNVRELRATR